MIVICKSNLEMEPILEIGKKYFVKSIKCFHNQIYYEIDGVNKYCHYYRFDLLSEIRNDKLKDLGIDS